MRRWLPLVGAPSLLLLLAGCLAVGPAGPYQNGQVVDVSITQFAPNATVWLSECGPGQVPSPSHGCTASVAQQQAVRLGSGGSGSAKFRVTSTVGGLHCAGYCTVNATDGRRVQQTPISFLGKGSLNIAAGFDTKKFDLYIGRFLAQINNAQKIPDLDINPGGYKVDFYDDAAGSLPGSTPLATINAIVAAGKGTAVTLFPVTATRVGLVQTTVPAPPAANRVRVTFVNETPVTVTPKLGTVTGTPVGTGRSVTLTLTGPANVPDGDDSWALSYAQRSGPTACGTGDAGGFFHRGHGYVFTIVAPQPANGTPACPYTLEPVVQGGIA
ncbi:MAG TPA: hypothetical protein VHX15_13320 [Frankiaceae bacterium]|nr:hypothetical protein [Frankiaceae bacterium]